MAHGGRFLGTEASRAKFRLRMLCYCVAHSDKHAECAFADLAHSLHVICTVLHRLCTLFRQIVGTLNEKSTQNSHVKVRYIFLQVAVGEAQNRLVTPFLQKMKG